MAVLRSDTHEITVKIDGYTGSPGAWTRFSGGEIDSEETKFKPGGMAPEVSLGGSVSIGNVTVARGYDPLVDDLHKLATLVGRAAVSVIVQPLDADQSPYGRARVYDGKLKSLTPPDSDASGNDAALFEIEVSVAGGLG